MSMTYAGRLDPMAQGVLIILAGDEVNNKEKYLELEKEYFFEILFGFKTDTYDLLGLPHLQIPHNKPDKKQLDKKINEHIKSFLGETMQKYPIYSSKTVDGKPLFLYARMMEEVKIPDRKIFVQKLKLGNIKDIDGKKLLDNIEKRISKVNGDFRQDEILKTWRKELRALGKHEEKFYIGSFKIKCSSGTYVRGIANSLGENMGIPALAYSIKRTKVGKYKIPSCVF